MMDETTKTALFRTGREDRTIPFALGLVLVAAVPGWAWLGGFASTPLFPWATVLSLAAAGGCFLRWSSARQSVTWQSDPDRLVIRRGRQLRSVPLSLLTGVSVRPAWVQTVLTAPTGRIALTHRLVRYEDLLDRIRHTRPDLFPLPEGRLRLRASAVAAGFTLGLGGACAAAAAAALVWPWNPWAGGFFVVGSGLALARVLSLPWGYTVTPGRLRVSRILGRRNYGRPQAVREDAYSAGGAVFFRMRLEYGRRAVVLDEGHLVDPLRPLAGWVVHQLTSSES